MSRLLGVELEEPTKKLGVTNEVKKRWGAQKNKKGSDRTNERQRPENRKYEETTPKIGFRKKQNRLEFGDQKKKGAPQK